MGLDQHIRELDTYFAANRPVRRNMDTIDDRNGRFVYGETPGDLFGQMDPNEEWLPSMSHVMHMRVVALQKLFRKVPAFADLVKTVVEEHRRPANFYDVTGQVRKVMDERGEHYGIWQVRLTTSTHMVRSNDMQGKDTVFFHDGNPFRDNQTLIDAVQGELSDGGIAYDADAVQNIHRTPQRSRLPYELYLNAKGGNFTGEAWQNHPIFATACGDPSLMERYAFSLQALSLLEPYHPGLHSGWRPGDMKPNFGRPISLGKVGEAFYPPNNSTVGHSALVLERRLPVDMEM